MESETELTTKVEYKGRSYFIKTDQGIDLSLKNNFDNKNPIFFKAKQSSLNPVQIGGFKGDIKQGGSCNVGIASIDIHCTGTHTECISHVSESETKIVDGELHVYGDISVYDDWFATGDMVEYKDGSFWYLGRKDA